MKLPKELTTVTPLSKTVALLMFILLPVIAFLLGMKFQQKMTLYVPPTQEEHAFCTMEAKVCPDGSAVGRTGANCEFAPCPVAPKNRGERFSGIITKINYECHVDGICSIKIDNRDVIVTQGGLRPPGENIQPLAMGSLNGINLNGENEEDYIGKEVDAYVGKISENNYTLYGDKNYFITLKNNSSKLFCGGIAGIHCPTGYECLLDGNYPDAGGNCVNSKIKIEEPLVKDCSNKLLNIKLKTPDNWTCENNENQLSVKSLTFNIDISNSGRSGPCGSAPDTTCAESEFYSNGGTVVKKYMTNFDPYKLLFGSTINNSWIKISYPEMKSRELTNEQVSELFNVLDTISLTK